MSALMNGVLQFCKEEEGATAVEYGVLIALIIAVCVVIIGVLGGQVRKGFSKVSSALTGAGITPL